MQEELQTDYKKLYDIFKKNMEDNRLDKGLFSLLRLLLIELKYKKDKPLEISKYKENMFFDIKNYKNEKKIKNLQDILDINLNDYIDYIFDIYKEDACSLYKNGYLSKREYNVLYKGWRLTNKTIYKFMEVYDIDKNFWQLFIK